jgi:predicted dithiol-disulfide oxidoreductase (DUF899 family)
MMQQRKKSNSARDNSESSRNYMTGHMLVPARDLAKSAKTPFPGSSDNYLDAQQVPLVAEIELRRLMTSVASQRRALPLGPLVEKNYGFRKEQGEEVSLVDLFGDKETPVAYFWMYDPQRERPCPMCTNWLGSVNGNAADIKQRVALKVFGRSMVDVSVPSRTNVAGRISIPSDSWRRLCQ